VAWGLACAAALAAAGLFNERLLDLRGDLELTQAPPTENMPPMVAFTTVALGGFRGILADILWMRSGTLQEEGRYFELVQLSDWIAKLQPRSSAIWTYHAWNMAYNLSALMPTPEERWHWVRNGLSLLRDEGMVYNPGSARLHQELAWMFLHKLGTADDTAAPYYREQWKRESLQANLRLNADVMAQLSKEVAPLDWSTPQAQAVYWAYTGLPFARTEFEDLALRRILYQALLQLVQQGQQEMIPHAIRAVEDTQRRHPNTAPLQGVLDRLQE
jgi:hypothetical protein